MPVKGVSAQVGEIAAESIGWLAGAVVSGIDMAAERRDPPRAAPIPKRIERAAAGIAQHRIEIAEAPRREIGRPFAGAHMS
jgi:hypothetical protein